MTKLLSNKENINSPEQNSNAENTQQVINQNAATAEPKAPKFTDILKEGAALPSESELREQQAQAEKEARDAELLEQARMNIIDLDEELPEPQTLVSVNDVPVIIGGELTALKAKQKTGKTLATAIMCAAALGCRGFTPFGGFSGCIVLYDDTEQSKNDAQKVGRRIRDLSGLGQEEFRERFHIVYHRECTSDERMDQIEVLARDMRPNIIIIDNVADMLDDFNNNTESKALVDRLLRLASETGAGIVTIQHENKAKDNPYSQGFLGSYQDKKGAVLMQCQKDDKLFKVVCVGSRHKEFDTWSFYFDSNDKLVNGDAEYAALQQKRKEEQRLKQEEKKKKEEERRWTACLNIMRHNTILHRSYLTSGLTAALDLSDSTISPLITKWIKEGKLKEDKRIISLVEPSKK